VTNNVYWDKKTHTKNTTTTKHEIKHKNPCRSQELNPGTHAPKATGYKCTSVPPGQLRLTIVVKLFKANGALLVSSNEKCKNKFII